MLIILFICSSKVIYVIVLNVRVAVALGNKGDHGGNFCNNGSHMQNVYLRLVQFNVWILQLIEKLENVQTLKNVQN